MSSPKKSRLKAPSILNGLLTIILILQIGAWGSVFFFNVIPVPELVFEKLKTRLAEHNITLQSDQPVIDLTGRISFSQAHVFFEGVSQAALHCDNLQIRIDPAHLIVGKIAIKEVTVSNGTFFCPALQSPSGLTEPMLNRLFCTLRSGRKSWEIDQLNFQLYKLRVAGSGYWNVPFPKQKEAEQLNIQNIFYKIAGSLVALSIPLQELKDPFLTLTLGQKQGTDVSATLYADGLRTAEGIKIGPLYAKAHGDWEYGLQPFKTVWARTASLEIPDSFQGNAMETQLLLAPSGNPIETEFFVGKAHIYNEPIEYLNGQVNIQAFPELSGNLAGSSEGATLELGGHIHTGEKSGALTLVGSVNPLKLKNYLAMDDALSRIGTMILPPKADIDAQISIGPEFTLNKAVFSLDLGPSEIDGFNSNRLNAQGHIDPNVLDLTFRSFHIDEVAGTFHQDLITKDYRLLVEGKLNPSNLNAWIQKNWWTYLWDDFNFEDTLPYANLDVQGRWGDPFNYFIYGNVKGTDFSYNRFPVEHMQLKVEARTNFLELSDIWIRDLAGEATARFCVDYDKNIKDFNRFEFTLGSTLAPNLIASPLNEKWQNLVSDFVFTEAPNLQVDGKLYGAHTGKPTTLSVYGETQAPVNYKEIPLDSIKVEAIQNGHLLDLKHITLGLADGIASGTAQIKYREGQTPEIAVQTHLIEANLAKVSKILHQFTLSEQERVQREIPAGLETGTFELKIDIQGPYGDLEHFKGQGELLVTSDDLAKINLFGSLSRLLDKAELPSGTLEFNEASAPFIVDQGYIYFPRFAFTGPSSKIDAKGDYSISQKDLNFQAKLFFLPMWGQILNPLSHVLEFHITGPIAKPEWQFSMFSNSKKAKRFDPESTYQKIPPTDETETPE